MREAAIQVALPCLRACVPSSPENSAFLKAERAASRTLNPKVISDEIELRLCRHTMEKEGEEKKRNKTKRSRSIHYVVTSSLHARIAMLIMMSVISLSQSSTYNINVYL